MTVSLRPHHVLCAIGFVGDAPDAVFVANMARIVTRTLFGPHGADTRVLITDAADSICAPCPLRDGLGCMAHIAVSRRDAAHGAALGLAPGMVTTWGDCLQRAATRVEPGDLDHICAGCTWLDSGTCKARLAALRERSLGQAEHSA